VPEAKAALTELKSVPLVFELKEQPAWAEPTAATACNPAGTSS
jgi:hypothetical protein